jgi:hypothetical protein
MKVYDEIVDEQLMMQQTDGIGVTAGSQVVKGMPNAL